MNTDDTDLQIQKMALLNFLDPCKSVLSVLSVVRFGVCVHSHLGPSFRLRAFGSSFLRRVLVPSMNDLSFELRQQHCLVAVGAGRNHSYLCAALARHKPPSLLRCRREIVKGCHAFSGFLPAWHPFVKRFNLREGC